MNLVFVITALLGLLGAGWTWRSARGGASPLTREGPVPGYSITPGGAIALPEDLPLTRGTDFVPVSLETFNSPGRARLVVRFDVRSAHPGELLERFCRRCSESLAERSGAHVVFVELRQKSGPAFFLWAGDERGWGGTEPVGEVFVQPGRAT